MILINILYIIYHLYSSELESHNWLYIHYLKIYLSLNFKIL